MMHDIKICVVVERMKRRATVLINTRLPHALLYGCSWRPHKKITLARDFFLSLFLSNKTMENPDAMVTTQIACLEVSQNINISLRPMSRCNTRRFKDPKASKKATLILQNNPLSEPC